MSKDELHELIMKTLCLVEMGPGFENSRFGWRHHADALVVELEALRADAAIGQIVRRRLVSGNDIPVSRAYVTAQEVHDIDAKETP